MICWKCKHEMPDGLKYCGNCGVRMNRVIYTIEWLFSKKGLPVLILLLALIIGGAVWGITSHLRVPEIVFDLDMGWYTPGDEDIVYDDDSKSFGYVSNMLLVYFTKDATDEQIAEVVDSVDGEVVGIIPGVRQYQIRVTTRTEAELEELCLKVTASEVVKYAVIDYVAAMEGETAYVPNDPWESGEVWDENNPDGSNWWVEATHLPSAWSYDSYFQHIDVGIVDNGFDTTHEDLKLTVLNPDFNSVEAHGTHIAGVMGAIQDNGIGITGILGDTTIYCVDCYSTDEQTAQRIAASAFTACMSQCLDEGCQVVNFSSGHSPSYAFANPEGVRKTARQTVVDLIMMLDSYDQGFIIVQSAGNGDGKGTGVDAHAYNGRFCSMDRELVQEVLDNMNALGALEKEITVDDVMNSIMVVASVDCETTGGSYQLAKSSNYGDAITIAAPGVHIYSTVPTGNAYAYKNGTSMAAPVAAGITAMVWSVDPTMSAAQVKDIVVSTATTPVLARTEGDTGTYYLIDAQAAVEKALNILAEKPTEPDETEPGVTEPPYTGEPQLPDLVSYIGDDSIEIITVARRVTDKENLPDWVAYWTTYGMDKSAESKLYDYMDLLVEVYHFELVDQHDGIYEFYFTGTNRPETFAEDDNLTIRITEEDDGTLTVDYYEDAGFTDVVHPN